MTTPDTASASETSSATDRRSVLRSAGIVGGAAAAAAALAACGSSGSSGSAEGDAATSGGSAAAGSGTAGGGSAAGKGVATSKVPVGSGVIDDDLKAVVTQPTKGDFKAFSYICTHQGCPVTQISGDTISCPCHGSQFSTKDGSVKHGPATKPLNAMTAKVEGTQVIVS